MTDRAIPDPPHLLTGQYLWVMICKRSGVWDVGRADVINGRRHVYVDGEPWPIDQIDVIGTIITPPKG